MWQAVVPSFPRESCNLPCQPSQLYLSNIVLSSHPRFCRMLGTTASRSLSALEIKSISHLLLKLCHFVFMPIYLLQGLQNINKHAVHRERVCEGKFLSWKHTVASAPLKNASSVFSLQLEVTFICNFLFYSFCFQISTMADAFLEADDLIPVVG